jgi:hypothetical protein
MGAIKGDREGGRRNIVGRTRPELLAAQFVGGNAIRFGNDRRIGLNWARSDIDGPRQPTPEIPPLRSPTR